MAKAKKQADIYLGLRDEERYERYKQWVKETRERLKEGTDAIQRPGEEDGGGSKT